MKLNYVMTVTTPATITEIHLPTLAAIKKEIAVQLRITPNAVIRYRKEST